MKNSVLHRIGFASLLGGLFLAGCGKEETPPTQTQNPSAKNTAAAPGGEMKPGMVPLALELPKFAYEGTPKGRLPAVTMEPDGTKAPVIPVPQGSVNLALKKKATGSSDDDIPLKGNLAMVTDGDKENNKPAEVENWLEYGAGKTWVQVDLEKSSEIYAVALWHFHKEPRIYYGVVVQISDDPEFAKDVTTIFNNDQQNICGLGVGKDLGYKESLNGKVIPANGVKGRYVRAYSKGSNVDDFNQLLEIEVWGVPAK